MAYANWVDEKKRGKKKPVLHGGTKVKRGKNIAALRGRERYFV